MNHDTTNGRNLASLLAEIKDETREFLHTRIAILKAELKEKSKTFKTAAILAVIASLLLLTAWFLFTLALVGLVVAAFPQSAYRWFFAFLAVGVLWSIFGGMVAYFFKRELQVRGLLPKRTIEVLKGDRDWVQSEVNSRI